MTRGHGIEFSAGLLEGVSAMRISFLSSAILRGWTRVWLLYAGRVHPSLTRQVSLLRRLTVYFFSSPSAARPPIVHVKDSPPVSPASVCAIPVTMAGWHMVSTAHPRLIPL
ncbi:hypothetical protein AVEN_136974-1 [Araneus ventricosus]|uniref:Uncharacterized protein n=1 Tax=Araneus ventricosus TaxID=182803 RepID=A0A4Y2BIU9_ARAVE|nr:hypothetical protein AVEN_136974-1 [Araneus ventricosus]